MTKNVQIAVLMTCFNRREKTLSCLDNLFRAALPLTYSLKVFLVDDGSKDGTKSAIKRLFPEVSVIHGNGNLYWNRGMRLAWETAYKFKDFDHYLWLNDDVQLLPNAIADLISTSKEFPESICIGAMRSKLKSLTTYGAEDKNGKLLDPNGASQKVYKFHGNLVLIPKPVFNTLGYLDKCFHHAIGDFDYALRAEKKDIAKYLAPEYTGYCEKHESLPLWCLPQTPLKKRITTLYSPLGNSHPYYFFIYEKRHHGLFVALKHFGSIHLRVLFPKLWKIN